MEPSRQCRSCCPEQDLLNITQNDFSRPVGQKEGTVKPLVAYIQGWGACMYAAKTAAAISRRRCRRPNEVVFIRCKYPWKAGHITSVAPPEFRLYCDGQRRRRFIIHHSLWLWARMCENAHCLSVENFFGQDTTGLEKVLLLLLLCQVESVFGKISGNCELGPSSSD